MEKNTNGWFHEGRGSVSAKVAKTNEGVVAQEGSQMMSGLQDYPNKKPCYATGESPFHEGRGLGRGQTR